MSEEGVQIVRAFTDAFNANDVEGIVSVCDPDVVFHSTFSAVGGADYRGHEGVRQWQRDIQDTWGEIHSAVEAIYDLGDHVLTFTLIRGQGKHSGANVELTAAIVTRVQRGRIVYFKGYAHREDALRDLGVSEDELEPIAP
jgi:ketosteroid isomerase-like protein